MTDSTAEIAEAAAHLRKAFELLGLPVPPETPLRYARALLEMSAGLRESPEDILATTYHGEGCESVRFRGIRFAGLCEHHLLPFWGTAAVRYEPNGRVVGLSKVTRLVHCFARRPTLQERITAQVADALLTHLGPKSVRVVLKARHGCMVCRGVSQSEQVVTTEAKRCSA